MIRRDDRSEKGRSRGFRASVAVAAGIKAGGRVSSFDAVRCFKVSVLHRQVKGRILFFVVLSVNHILKSKWATD